MREVKDVKEASEVSCTGSLRRLPPRVQKSDRDTPPRVFWKKSAQAIENKGRESKKERQEVLRGGKSLMGRGLEGARRNGSVRFVRNNTRNGTIDLDVCQ